MSFSATVKDELCRLELGKNCCMLSELAALYRTSGSLTFHGGGRVQVQYRVCLLYTSDAAGRLCAIT